MRRQLVPRHRPGAAAAPATLTINVSTGNSGQPAQGSTPLDRGNGTDRRGAG